MGFTRAMGNVYNYEGIVKQGFIVWIGGDFLTTKKKQKNNAQLHATYMPLAVKTGGGGGG